MSAVKNVNASTKSGRSDSQSRPMAKPEIGLSSLIGSKEHLPYINVTMLNARQYPTHGVGNAQSYQLSLTPNAVFHTNPAPRTSPRISRIILFARLATRT